MKFKIVMLMTTILTFLAAVGSAGACAAVHYQPEVPQSLKR